MKKLLTLILLLPTVLWAQNAEEVQNLVAKGVRMHDKGLYPEAIAWYQEALALDSTSGLIYYELAFTYFAMEEYEKAIAASKKVLELDDRYGLEATNNIGNSLDMLGRSQEAVDVFKKGIKTYGEDARLYFNMGITLMHMERLYEGLSAFEQALLTSPVHASSAYNLASYHLEQGEMGKGVLAGYYFLLLEPTGDRAEHVYDLLMKSLAGEFDVEGDQVTVYIDPNAMEEEFGMVNMLVAATSMAQRNLDELGESDYFQSTTDKIFATVWESKKRRDKGLYWELLAPLFYSLSQSEYMDAFCAYIRVGNDEEAIKWVKANNRQVEEMAVFAQSEIERVQAEMK